MTCCTNGVVGRHDGETVYCDCLKGLEAHMNYLAYLMQEQAETLTRIDAMRDLPIYLMQLRKTVAQRFDECKAEYDALEIRWYGAKQKVDPHSLEFFSERIREEMMKA